MGPEIQSSEMFHPPINRAMRILDRAFFQKSVSLAAARVFENSNISSLRSRLGKEMLKVDRISPVKNSPVSADGPLNRKAILLHPDIRPDDPKTWSTTLTELCKEEVVAVVPFEMQLDYSYWDYDDIMRAILPIDDDDGIPGGFAQVGHVAHLNLRPQYLEYKNLISEVLIDKNHAIRTVINKIDDVGAEDVFRTFKYELLRGDPSLLVEVKEQGCTFRFDYSKVFWNPRLNTEHEKMVDLFQPGEAVCDVMAGVGPFAVPAAKKKVFVWGNDLNPAGYQGMKDASELNQVQDFLRPHNMDGRHFIRDSAQQMLKADYKANAAPKAKQFRGHPSKPRPPPPRPEYLVQPKTFQHYVMNLPASATDFLDAFIGIYEGQERVFLPEEGRKLPLIHVYCFSTKGEDVGAVELQDDICSRLSQSLGHTMAVGKDELVIRLVRHVAPNKWQFCATFRLPKEVAFKDRGHK